MNSCSVQEKVSHDPDDRSLPGVLRAIVSRGHSHMGPRIRIVLAPHPSASFGGRHDMHCLESCRRPIYVRDGKSRWLSADLDDTRDICEPFASNLPYTTYRCVCNTSRWAGRCQPFCSGSAGTFSPIHTLARAGIY